MRAGVDVVGRTRFCVHPADRVRAIPVVGGTKDLKADELNALEADLVVLDREENPREFVERIRGPVLDTHVDSIAALERELRRLAGATGSAALTAEADRARRIRDIPAREKPPGRLPGAIEELTPFSPEREVLYVIWKNPWMIAGAGTFIDDVLGKLGFRRRRVAIAGTGAAANAASSAAKYPPVGEAEFAGAYALFSSEPFPFAKKTAELRGFDGAVVDGEGFSWFGSRALDFLERELAGG